MKNIHVHDKCYVDILFYNTFINKKTKLEKANFLIKTAITLKKSENLSLNV